MQYLDGSRTSPVLTAALTSPWAIISEPPITMVTAVSSERARMCVCVCVYEITLDIRHYHTTLPHFCPTPWNLKRQSTLTDING